MTAAKAHDLTDTWHGRFTYPDGATPTSFIVELQHVGNRLSGTIEEAGIHHAADLVLTSSLAGTVAGDAVTFVKTYDVVVADYAEAVHYEGAVRDEGLEIAGTWTIPGAWSGSFLMIRSRGLSRAASRKQAEKV